MTSSALSDLTHPPVVALAAPAAAGPITASEPLPVPAPVAPTRTAVTAAAPAAAPSTSPIAGIAPAVVVPVVPPVTSPPSPPVAPSAVTAPAAPAAVPAAPAAVPAAPEPDPVFVPATVVGAVAPIPIIAPVVPAPVTDADAVNPAGASGPVSASVAAFAAKHAIDLATVTGTGSRGRITMKDVEALIAGASTEASDADTPTETVGSGFSQLTAAAPTAAATTPSAAPSSIQDSGAVEVAAVEVRVPFDLRDGRKFAIDASTDFALLATGVLPGLKVTAAFLELTADGAALVVTVAPTAAVTL